MPENSIYLIHLPILIVMVSLVYSATRFDRWGPILWEALRWGGRLVGFLFCVAGLLSILNQHLLIGVAEELIAALVWVVFYLFSKP